MGDGCEIGPDTRVVDSRIGDGAVVEHAVVRESTVGDRSHVGPVRRAGTGHRPPVRHRHRRLLHWHRSASGGPGVMERVTTKRMALYSGRTHPALAEEIAEHLGVRARRRQPGGVRQRRGAAPLRRERPRHRRLHHPDALRLRRALHQRLDHGAADHDRRRAPGVGQAHHRGLPLLRLRPAGPQGRGPRAHHGPPRRRPVQGRGGQAHGQRRPPLRPDPGLLRRPGRPPHRHARPRGVHARALRSRRRHHRPRRRPGEGGRALRAAPRRPQRRPRLHQQAPPQGHGQRRRGQGGHRRGRRPALRDHRRHDRHRVDHRLRGRDPPRAGRRPRCGPWPPTACSPAPPSTG